MAKSDKFVIESYKVTAVQTALETRYHLSLVSPDLSHGIRTRALLIFTSTTSLFKQWKGIGMAENVGGANFDGINMTISCDFNLFDGFYAILSTEKPVYLLFWYDNLPNSDPNGTSKMVLSIELSTDSERPGDHEVAQKFITFQPLEAVKEPSAGLNS